MFQNDWETVQACAEQSLALFLETGDRWTAGGSLRQLGAGYALGKNDYESARSYYQKFLNVSREAKDKFNIMWGLTVLGDVAYLQGDFSQMEGYFQACLEACREIGFKMGEIWSPHHLGIAALRMGEDRRAAGLMMESLTMALDYQNSLLIKEGLDGAAGIAVFRGQLARAARLFGAVEVLYSDLFTGPIDQADRERDIATLRAQMDETALRTAWDEGRGLTLEQAILEARAICE
jgi:tetratricopeptide (TPR) repeat protein